jgi:hypothetical protein
MDANVAVCRQPLFFLAPANIHSAINNCSLKNGECGSISTGHRCIYDGPGLHHCKCPLGFVSTSGDGKNCKSSRQGSSSSHHFRRLHE